MKKIQVFVLIAGMLGCFVRLLLMKGVPEWAWFVMGVPLLAIYAHLVTTSKN